MRMRFSATGFQALTAIFLLLLVLVGYDLVLAEDPPEDPYATLGLSRKATIKEIKRAYKNMAKEWHPDKNDSPKAHEKFLAINRAYEILSDPLKKERYDKYGTFDEQPQSSSGGYHRHHFEEFFGFGFGGFDNGNSYFQKHRISMRIFSNSLLEKSFNQPIIIFAYSGYCQLCFRLEPIWQSVVEDLEPLGYGIGTVNAITDGNLLEKLRVSRLPSIVVVVEGRVIHYRGSMHPLSAKSIRLFARDVIPNSFLIKIANHDGLRRFVDQWKYYNKISVMIIGVKEDPRLRYLLMAMKYAKFARFAYIHMNNLNEEIATMKHALAISCSSCENILIFNDFPQNGPVARLTVTNGKQLSVEAMSALIDSNKHLVLTRLSSQWHMDDLCPISSRSSRKLCAILMVLDTNADQQYVDEMRLFMKNKNNFYLFNTKQKIQFVYLFIDKHKEFILPFMQVDPNKDRPENQENRRDILVIWRTEYNQARFVWLRGIWGISDGISNGGEGFEEDLKKRLDEIVHDASKLNQQAVLVNLVDEYRPSLFTRISRSIMRMSETAWFHMNKEETLPILSAFGTFAIILFIGYALNYAAISQQRSTAAEKRRAPMSDADIDEQWHPEDPQTVPKRVPSPRSMEVLKQKRIMREMTPLMHELRAETYFGMIRLLKPGCRSIIILVDEQSKDILLPQFAKYIWPIRNNKTFSFGYLMVEKNLQWFRKLLEFTLPVETNTETNTDIDTTQDSANDKPNPANNASASMYERLKQINPRKTLGTVLVLCGWKLYFNMYHPMHTAARRRNFLGFDEENSDDDTLSDDSDSDSAKATHEEVQALRKCNRQLKLEDVLNGLPNWLDRLFEGSIRRYYIPEWPDNLK